MYDSQLDKHIESFLDYIGYAKHYSRETVKSYRCCLGKLTTFLVENNIDDYLNLSKEEILNFLKHVSSSIGARSIRLIITTLRSFYKYLVQEEITKKNPWKYVNHPKIPKNIKQIPSAAEVIKFLDSLPIKDIPSLRNKAMFETLYACGLRASEIINLKLSDVDFDQEILSVTGKGDKQRLVPIGKPALIAINKYVLKRNRLFGTEHGGYLFLNIRGKRLSRQGMWKILKKYVGDSGWHVNVYPHLFRHCCGTHMYENGADLRMIQKFLGHTSISTTEIYTQLSTKFIKSSYYRNFPRGCD